LKRLSLKPGATFAGILFAALLLSRPASAGTLYTNLSNGSGSGGDINSNTWYANAFSTGSSSYSLGNVTLELKGESGATGTFSVWLYSSVSNAPGSALETLGNSVADSGISSSSFNSYIYSGGGYALAANTMYWIVVGGTGEPGFDVNWERALSATISSVGPGAQASSSNGGSSWFANSLSSDYKPDLMEVDSGGGGGGSAPEPGTFLPVLAGAAGLAAVRLRLRSRGRR
jgi:hypothetical protein